MRVVSSGLMPVYVGIRPCRTYVKKDRQRLGIGGEDHKLGGSTREGLGRFVLHQAYC